MCLRLAREAGPKPEDVAIPVETAPGEVAQVDFVYAGKIYDPERGVLRRAWLFVMALGFSRHMFCDLVFDQKVETWIRLHVDAFEYFGRRPEVVVPDNLKAAVIRAAFGARRRGGAEPQLPRAGAPLRLPDRPDAAEKSGEEGQGGAGGVVREAQLLRDPHARWTSRWTARLCWRWREEVAATRRHGTTGQRPGEVFEDEERAALRPLPAKPYEVVIWKRATLHRDAHVQIDGAFYSAPWKYIGERLDVRGDRQARRALPPGGAPVDPRAGSAGGSARRWNRICPRNGGELRKRSRSYWGAKARRWARTAGAWPRRSSTPTTSSISCARCRPW